MRLKPLRWQSNRKFLTGFMRQSPLLHNIYYQTHWNANAYGLPCLYGCSGNVGFKTRPAIRVERHVLKIGWAQQRPALMSVEILNRNVDAHLAVSCVDRRDKGLESLIVTYQVGARYHRRWAHRQPCAPIIDLRYGAADRHRCQLRY